MIKNFQTIELEIKDSIATVWLNRPQIHNAFNELMIAEILQCYTELNNSEEIRAVVMRGRGKTFCAGADLNWMRDVADYSYDQNYTESLQLSNCFYAIYACIKPTIALVHGAAIGGANGLLASCDFAFADENTVFSLSEVKIGIIPACISPYIIKRVGEYKAKDLMLTGRRIKGAEAEKVGLVNKSFPGAEMENQLDGILESLITSGPKAISHCKRLIDEVSNNLTHHDALEFTARMIAEIRASDEGQEGMAAFLEKRKPNWVI